MVKIRQHIPNFVDTDDPPSVASVSSKEDVFEIPFFKYLKNHLFFEQLCVDDMYLVAFFRHCPVTSGFRITMDEDSCRLCKYTREWYVVGIITDGLWEAKEWFEQANYEKHSSKFATCHCKASQVLAQRAKEQDDEIRNIRMPERCRECRFFVGDIFDPNYIGCARKVSYNYKGCIFDN